MRTAWQKTCAVIVGYALLLIFFGLFTGRVNLLFFGGRGEAIFSAYAHAVELGQIACLLAFALFSFYWQKGAERLAPLFAFIFMVAGYALTLYQAVGNADYPLLPDVAGALFGCGWSACFLCWMKVLSRFSPKHIVLILVVSTILSGIMLFFIGLIGDTVLLFSVLSVIIAGCCALIYFCLEATRPTAEEPRAAEARQFFSWTFIERRSLLCLIAIAFVCGAQRVVSLEIFLSQDAVSYLFSIGYIGGALVFWGASRFQGGQPSYHRIYSALLLTMATCGVLSSIPNVRAQTVLYAIDNIAFAIVSMCMISTVLEGVKRSWDNPLFAAGLVCGGMYFSIQFGRFVCNLISTYIGMDTVGIFMVSVIILYVVALAAISSGFFFRHATKNVEGAKDGAAADDSSDSLESERVIISVASVTEDDLRKNPIYRQQYKLTNREIDVAILLLAGYNATDIASILVISVNTVKTHLKNLYAKTNVHGRRELVELLNQIEGGATNQTESTVGATSQAE